MAIVIAGNYCRDLRRRDLRLLRLTPVHMSLNAADTAVDQFNFVDYATDKVFQEEIFLFLAREIAHFPWKQRQALLIDLAHRMVFDTKPTALQKAFLEAGIQLQAYQVALSNNPLERSRHASLLHYAYKRVARLRQKL